MAGKRKWTIEQGWRDILETSAPPDADPVQLEYMRQAFWAGSFYSLHLVAALARRMSDAELSDAMEKLYAEVDANFPHFGGTVQ